MSSTGHPSGSRRGLVMRQCSQERGCCVEDRACQTAKRFSQVNGLALLRLACHGQVFKGLPCPRADDCPYAQPLQVLQSADHRLREQPVGCRHAQSEIRHPRDNEEKPWFPECLCIVSRSEEVSSLAKAGAEASGPQGCRCEGRVWSNSLP